MSYLKDFLIILDMDNTLIGIKTFEESDECTYLLRYKIDLVRVLNFHLKNELNLQDENINSEKWNYAYNNTYLIPRPGLYSFLDFLFANFTVGLWTSAEKFWMDFNLNTVLKKYKNKFLFTWSREYCIMGIFKKIGIINIHYHDFVENCILIDDNPYVTGYNCIDDKVQKIPKHHLLIKRYIAQNEEAGFEDVELFLIKNLFEKIIKEGQDKLVFNIYKLVYEYNNNYPFDGTTRL